MNRLALKFLSNESTAELFETIFHSPLVSRELRCGRGRYHFTQKIEGTFLWSSAVMSMCALFLKAKLAQLGRNDDKSWNEEAGLSSDSSDWATSIDFALSKKPRWLLDMFGVDSTGQSVTKRLFIRMNPERKRPGPVRVSVNPAFLDPSDISISLDGQEMNTPPLIESLLRRIGFEASHSTKSRDTTTKVISLFPSANPLQPDSLHSEVGNVLVPFLDHYMLSLSGYGLSARRDSLIEQDCRTAFRLALSISDCVFVPAVSYVQSRLCRRILDEHLEFAELGAVRLITDARNWREFFRLRIREYAKGSSDHQLYSSKAVKGSIDAYPSSATFINTTHALRSEWIEQLRGSNLQKKILSTIPSEGACSRISAAYLASAADQLGTKAFNARNLNGVFAREHITADEHQLTRIICDLFFEHYRSHFNLTVVDNLAYLQSLGTTTRSPRIGITSVLQKLRERQPSLLQRVSTCKTSELWALRRDVISTLYDYCPTQLPSSSLRNPN